MEIKPFDHKVWLSSPTMHGEELKYVTEAYETNWMSTVGENINEVERLACEKIGCKYAVALSAGTAALHMAVKLAGVKPGDRVFCSDMTFDATVNPVRYEGGEPIFIDTEYDTWNMDPVALKKPLRSTRTSEPWWRPISTARREKSMRSGKYAEGITP